jgi:GNAT superfamily N-acetyltransferase
VSPLPAAELGELEAFVDIYEAAEREVGARVERLGGAVCLALPPVPRSAMFNRALGLGLERPATEDDVEEIAGFFRQQGVDWCAAVAPQAEPVELASWLAARGLANGYAWAKFRRGVTEAPESASELRVDRVDGREAHTFADVFIRGYGVPELMRDWLARLPERSGWHCFVAYDGDAPAATGALYAARGVGWLGIAATLPEHRRRGAQGALLAERIRAAAEAGCAEVVTETGELLEGKPSSSYRNILRAGFELDYVRPNYLSSPRSEDEQGSANPPSGTV